MNDLTPREPKRPIRWPDAILDLADTLADSALPIYAVGGAVRDAYFGLPLHDLDLAIESGATPLARRIANTLGGDVYVMDADRDVARVTAQTPHGRLSIDVAAFRGPDLLTDLVERDFTLNAMAVDLRHSNLLIDPLNGETDLIGKLIRRCSERSIASDPIRALRAVRQSVQLNAHIEKQTMLDIRANAGRLYETSPERVRDEFMKLLGGPRPHAALRIAHILGLLAPIMPDVTALPPDQIDHTLRIIENVHEIYNVISPRRNDNTAAAFGLGALVVALDAYRRRLQEHLGYEWPNERPHRALLNVAGLLNAVMPNVQHVGSYIDSITEHVRLSNPERSRLLGILKADPRPIIAPEPLDALMQHRFWHSAGLAGIDLIILTLARYLADNRLNIDQNDWVRVLERARVLLDAYFGRHGEIVAPASVIDGNRLMKALDLKPGPVIRELLDLIREGQVTGEVTDEESAFALARSHLRE
jgi:poly(A) polymerase